MTSNIRLTFSVERSPEESKPSTKRKLDDFYISGISNAGRPRDVSASGGLLARRNRAPMHVDTGARVASLPPPEVSPLDVKSTTRSSSLPPFESTPPGPSVPQSKLAVSTEKAGGVDAERARCEHAAVKVEARLVSQGSGPAGAASQANTVEDFHGMLVNDAPRVHQSQRSYANHLADENKSQASASRVKEGPRLKTGIERNERAAFQATEAPRFPTPLAGETDSLEWMKTKMMGAFVEAGVPTDLAGGGMAAKIAHAVAGVLANAVRCSQDADALAAREVSLPSAERSCQLRESIAERARLSDRFESLRKRATRHELESKLERVEAKLDKLRAPHARLEAAEASVAEVRARMALVDANVEDAKERFEDELKRVKAARRAFERDIEQHDEARKRDLDDLKRAVDGLKDKSNEMEDRLEDVQAGLGQCSRRLHTVMQELTTLKKHVDDVAKDDRAQQSLNVSLSAGLRELRDKQFQMELELDGMMKEVENRASACAVELSREVDGVKSQFKRSFAKACEAFN
ncbi:uncharacterized protein PV09_08362 [Verruconis gallopava]|uniref:Uncharacterized protein n=1 Tax=Verruconis gallopava TaxID=253628 RepID=A0A0D2ALP8_9PEZI|nr:uncharacterized protein PV09_08362 [Verruconis gallopava]KIW00009.1 hypothetical protein PV09_08362 [Verruconis gallopava]